MSGMSFCDDHWARLRIKVDEAGLGHLVSANGQIAAMKEASALQGDEPTLENFDPLMFAHNAIMFNAINLLGGLFEGCPLCTLEEVHQDTCAGQECMLDETDAFAFWLDKAVEDAAEVAGRIE